MKTKTALTDAARQLLDHDRNLLVRALYEPALTYRLAFYLERRSLPIGLEP